MRAVVLQWEVVRQAVSERIWGDIIHFFLWQPSAAETKVACSSKLHTYLVPEFAYLVVQFVWCEKFCDAVDVGHMCSEFEFQRVENTHLASIKV